ncbi:hypothetical protein [Alloactinosynnema sp. L-07]|uniref:hypothetical protein n=1 Tax=Alloactinosynnema sp. L-07 TaxID=1653480 RepID=UPI00065EF987|nr:hypothetical protein [Alloactinosynnema sp. L-07]CRK55668.1 hypothetical protein [Alloactinosynnema sp. L-07]
MSFHWRYENASGDAIEGPSLTFEDQTEAEEWFSTTWSDLLALGVDQVVLLEGETEVYGPMSLHPPAN